MAKATDLIVNEVYTLLDKGVSPTRISEMLLVSRRQVYYLRDQRPEREKDQKQNQQSA